MHLLFDRRKRSFLRFLPPLATGIAYYVAADFALCLTRGSNGIATLWPSSGILFAALLISQPKSRKWHLLAAAAASLAANLKAGTTISVACAFTTANLLESLIASFIVRARTSGRVIFSDPQELVIFCFAVSIGAIASATVAAMMAPEASVHFWLSWFATDLLGALIVAPLILIMERTIFHDRTTVGSLAALEMALAFGAVLLVAIGTFYQSRFSLLFMPMLTVLYSALRYGPLGAATSVSIVAVTSSLATVAGYGPPETIHADPLIRSLFLQIYLLALIAAALPIAALLAARTRLANQLAEKMRLLQLAESAAHVGHWRLEAATSTVTWSQEVFRIHGIDDTIAPALDAALDAYHIEDRALVSEEIAEAIRENRGFNFTARIVRPDGEIRHVLSRGEIDRSNGEGPPGLFGIIQDITAQVVNERLLDGARLRAEIAAAQATIISETDQLTGIANRRRASQTLEQAAEASRRNNEPVSLALFDIDHFKKINDTFGHQIGDQVLQRIANDAKQQLRDGDTLGRFGGEEFVIVLPNTTIVSARTIAERLRAAIETGPASPKVTVSIGVAELTFGETCDALIKRADQALYLAKREGRNTLRMAA